MLIRKEISLSSGALAQGSIARPELRIKFPSSRRVFGRVEYTYLEKFHEMEGRIAKKNKTKKDNEERHFKITQCGEDSENLMS